MEIQKTTIDWREFINNELKETYMINLSNRIKQDRLDHIVYPPKNLVFNAFKLTPFDKVKVVMLGQNPYFNEGQAMGLAFSVPSNITTPPSLINIGKELRYEYGKDVKLNDLTPWAKQGVLLLNTSLTVLAGDSTSHLDIGWEIFTNKVIETLSHNRSNIIFCLWGNPARAKAKLIDKTKHLVLESPHPSPLSATRGFFGNGHFKQINKYLLDNNLSEIDWFAS